MRVLLVDDEPPARARLRRLLGEIPGVEVAGEAADGEAALAEIRALAPDVVLLDIRMPGLDGLAVAAEPGLPPVIFVTAHDEHAVAAFEAAAVDYLLKPVSPERLRRALDRARERGEAGRAAEVLRALAQPSRLTARCGGRTVLLDPARLTRLHAEEKYVVALEGGAEHLLDASLSELATELAPLGFVRIHRSELVRVSAIRRLDAPAGGDGGEVVLEDGQTARVSRRELPALRRRLAGLSPRR